MLLSLSSDLATIFIDNVFSKQLDLIAFYNSDERLKAYTKQFEDNPKLKHNLERVTDEDGVINMDMVRANKERFEGVKIFPGMGPDPKGQELNYESKYRFSAGIEFCMKGIHLNKLGSKLAR